MFELFSNRSLATDFLEPKLALVNSRCLFFYRNSFSSELLFPELLCRNYDASTDLFNVTSVDQYYNSVVDILRECANLFIAKHKKNYYNFWWSQELEQLEQNAIASCRAWILLPFELSLVIWWVLDLFCFRHLIALSYSGKVTKAFPLTPCGYKMAAKRVAWEVLLLPHH